MDLMEKPSRAEELERTRRVLDLEHVLSSPQGRRVMLQILERCGVYRSAFTGDQAATSLRLGEQNIGLWLIAQLDEVGPRTYPSLLNDRANMKEEEAHAAVDAEE